MSTTCQLNPVVGMGCQYTDGSGVNWNDAEVTALVPGSGHKVDLTYNGGVASASAVPRKICLDEDATDYHTWGCQGHECPPGDGGGIRPR